MHRKLVPMILLAAALSVLPAVPAGAAPVAMDLSDPPGDAPDPQLDITAFGLALEPAKGALVGSVTLGAAPTPGVINMIDLTLGRYSRRAFGTCQTKATTTIWIPNDEDVAAGFPWPYAELFPPGDGSEEPFGFLPTAIADDGRKIDFSSGEANEQVFDAIRKRTRGVNCLELETVQPDSYDTGDSITTSFTNGPIPRCKIAQRRVKRGRTLVSRCSNVRGRVKVTWIRNGGRTSFSAKRKVGPKGRLGIGTLKSWRRGEWRLTIWSGDLVAGTALLKLR